MADLSESDLPRIVIHRPRVGPPITADTCTDGQFAMWMQELCGGFWRRTAIYKPDTRAFWANHANRKRPIELLSESEDQP